MLAAPFPFFFSFLSFCLAFFSFFPSPTLARSRSQESFRSITRSYYRGAGGALLVFDIASRSSFDACASWLHDLRSWGEDDVCVLLVGNKADLVEGEAEDRDQDQDREGVVDEGPPGGQGDDGDEHDSGPRSRNSVEQPATPSGSGSERPTADALDLGSANDPTSTRRRRRQVTRAEATAWATEHGVAGYVETSAKSGRGVDAAFDALTREVHRRQQASRASVVGSKRSSSSRGAGSGRGPSSSLPKVLRLGSTEGGGGQGATNGCC